MKGWVEPKKTEVKRLVHLIPEWLSWNCTNIINEYTSAAETDIIIVTLPSKNIKAC